MKTARLVSFILCSLLLTLFNNCQGAFDPVHEDDLMDLSSLGCLAELEATFRATYHPFLVANCKTCHVVGGAGNGSFAQADAGAAFSQFMLRGADLIKNRAVDANHQSPYTGPQHIGTIAGFEPSWQAASTRASICSGTSGPTGSTTVRTKAKNLNATTAAQNLTWDLGSEIASPGGTSFSGGRLNLRVVTVTTPTGEKNYQFSAFTIRGGTTQALRASYVEILINDQIIASATTYKGVDRRVPANAQRDLSITNMIVPYNFKAGDKIALAFGRLEAVDFNPPTFAQLIGAGGVFANNCLSCHGPTTSEAGLDMTNRNNLVSRFMVAPFSPSTSEIYKRMTDSTRPMPAAGLLAPAQQKSVEDWINDGAP